MCYRFFLVNAANIMILGAIWNLNESGKGCGSLTFHDQNRELTAIDTSTRVLDFCGQRNAFARKYSIMIKDLRQELSKGLSNAAGDVAATRADSLNLIPNNPYPVESSQPITSSDLMPESQGLQNTRGTLDRN